MKFNIQPNDLEGMISKLTQYASQLSGISGSMKSYAGQLSSSWQDTQYLGFISQIESTGRQMAQTQLSFVEMARDLRTLKQNLEKAHADAARLRR